MRELIVDQKQLRDEKGRLHTYNYSILVGEMAVSHCFACESYGVRICAGDGEMAEVPDITVSIPRIDELMEFLVRNVVTPCTLKDVVDDWL